jgi:serine/threonine protein kinase
VDLSPGSTFAGYEIRSEIGRGAMGVVYRAYDPKLDREVALKVVAEHLAQDSDFRSRFIQEARSAARVEHPSVVAVYETGEVDEVPFLAMRLIRGRELSEIIAECGRLTPGEALRILRPIAEGLDAAHTVGIVHRDVKPANILVPDDGSGAVLVDFGIGRVMQGTRATQTGSWLGTVDYVAPEQIRGSDVDGRADQYALGCVLFEMLAGEPPFRRQDTIQSLFAHANEVPPVITLGDTSSSDRINKALEEVLSKDPADRFASCSAFADAVSLADPIRVVPDRGPTGTVVSTTPGGLATETPVVSELKEASAGALGRRIDRRVLVGGALTVIILLAVTVIVIATNSGSGSKPSEAPSVEGNLGGGAASAPNSAKVTSSCSYAVASLRDLAQDLATWYGFSPGAIRAEIRRSNVAVNTCASASPDASGLDDVRSLLLQSRRALPLRVKWTNGVFRFQCYNLSNPFGAEVTQRVKDECAVPGSSFVEVESRAPAPANASTIAKVSDLGDRLYELYTSPGFLTSQT